MPGFSHRRSARLMSKAAKFLIISAKLRPCAKGILIGTGLVKSNEAQRLSVSISSGSVVEVLGPRLADDVYHRSNAWHGGSHSRASQRRKMASTSADLPTWTTTAATTSFFPGPLRRVATPWIRQWRRLGDVNWRRTPQHTQLYRQLARDSE